jgi:hypothetical protein
VAHEAKQEKPQMAPCAETCGAASDKAGGTAGAARVVGSEAHDVEGCCWWTAGGEASGKVCSGMCTS